MKRLPWIPRLNRLHIHAAELGNSRGNISHLGKELAGALLPDQGIKNAEAQAPEVCSTAAFGYWGGGLFASGSRGGLCGIFCLIWSLLFPP